jgi:hypothetical protein
VPAKILLAGLTLELKFQLQDRLPVSRVKSAKPCKVGRSDTSDTSKGQSSNISCTHPDKRSAGAAGFFILSQSGERPLR